MVYLTTMTIAKAMLPRLVGSMIIYKRMWMEACVV